MFLGTGFSGATIPSLPEAVDHLQFLVPGIVGFAMLFGASFAGLSILADRDVGFLKEILVAPVIRTSIVLGWISGGFDDGNHSEPSYPDSLDPARLPSCEYLLDSTGVGHSRVARDDVRRIRYRARLAIQ